MFFNTPARVPRGSVRHLRFRLAPAGTEIPARAAKFATACRALAAAFRQDAVGNIEGECS